MTVELMNMNMDARHTFLTLTYEYIPGHLPSGFSKVSVLWLDVDGCESFDAP